MSSFDVNGYDFHANFFKSFHIVLVKDTAIVLSLDLEFDE